MARNTLIKLLLLLCITYLSSCNLALLNIMVKDPKVEKPEDIQSFLLKHNYSTNNSFLLKSDTSKIVSDLMLAMTRNYYIFDKHGELLCYNRAETCSGTQFMHLISNNKDSIAACDDDSITFQKIINSTVDFDLLDIDTNQFPKSDYYVITYWAKFLGGKRAYENSVAWMEQEIIQKADSTKITFLKINTDLREDWGMKPNGKANLRLKTKDNKLEIRLKQIPYK